MVRPKSDFIVSSWGTRQAPRTLAVEARVGAGSWVSPALAFVPRFVVATNLGREVVSGETCAVLSAQHPNATLWIWGGGQAIEANFGHEMRHVNMFIGDSAGSATLSVTLMLRDLLATVHDNITLILESRTSGQVETCIVQVNPSVQEPCEVSKDSTHITRGTSSVFSLVYRLPFFLVATLAFACMCCTSSWSKPWGIGPSPGCFGGLGFQSPSGLPGVPADMTSTPFRRWY